MSEREALKPCPFCGGDAENVGDARSYKIACSNEDCEASAGPFWVTTPNEPKALERAETAWNTRALAMPDREVIARALYEHWIAEDFANEYCGWAALGDQDTWLARADAILALTVGGGQ